MVLNKRVARMEENGSYAAIRLAADENGGFAFGAQNHLGPTATKVGCGIHEGTTISIADEIQACNLFTF
nr:hypothetical protein Iba_chr06cCG7950 [Ipomoea batatas]GMD10474.1 hypothetical protein Iba_chr06eCG6590 [Ipomoea batatas]